MVGCGRVSLVVWGRSCWAVRATSGAQGVEIKDTVCLLTGARKNIWWQFPHCASAYWGALSRCVVKWQIRKECCAWFCVTKEQPLTARCPAMLETAKCILSCYSRPPAGRSSVCTNLPEKFFALTDSLICPKYRNKWICQCVSNILEIKTPCIEKWWIF